MCVFDTLGMDIGAESVKVALVSGGKLRRAAEIPYPEDYFSEGWVTEPARMGRVLREALRQQKIRAGSVAMQLPGEVSYVHTASMPIMNAKQLRLNLRFAFTDYISDNLDSYAFDYAMLQTPKALRAALSAPPSEEGGEKTMDFLAVAAPLALLAQIRRTLEGAKLRLVKAAPPECSCLSLIRAALGAEPDKEYCILDLGARAIRLYIFRGERHVVTRALELGMRELELPVARHYQIARDKARAYYRENHGNCQYLDACMEVYSALSLELTRTINFYRFSHQDSTVQDVWIIGGGAGAEPMADVVGKALDMNVHPASELIAGGVEFPDCYRYAQAVGAALC